MIAIVLMASLFVVASPPKMIVEGSRWNAWPTLAPLRLPASAKPRFVRLGLTQAVDPGARGAYADLRIIDDTLAEVPYVIDPEQHRSPGPALALSDGGFVRGAYTQIVVDAGADGALHSALEIVSERPTYFERVIIDASDDRRVWRTIRPDGLIYRVAADGVNGNQTVSVSPTHSRWLRVRVMDPKSPFSIASVVLRDCRRPEVRLDRLNAAAEVDPGAPTMTQRWTFDAGGPHVAVTGIEFTGGGGRYERTVTVESSADRRTWTSEGDGTLFRLGAGVRDSLVFAESNARFWRVSIDNGNDRPIEGIRPDLLARRRDLVFRAEPGRRYTVLLGRPNSQRPVYDLAAQLQRQNWRATERVSLAAFAPNQNYRDPRPPTERNPYLAQVAFLAGAGLLAIFALRTLKAAP